jgi:quinoprotein glucose dehydrogenase
MLKSEWFNWVFFLLLLLTSFACTNNEKDDRLAGNDWPVYLGSNGSAQYSTLKQINKENISLLKPAWQFQAGGHDVNNKSQIQCNPLIINGFSLELALI